MQNTKKIMSKFIKQYITEVKNALDSLDIDTIEYAVELFFLTYRKNKRVFVIGNGGSAATAAHMSCDLGKGTLARIYSRKEKRLKIMSLSDNIATLTAYANDLSFQQIFVQQLRNLIEKDDLLIVLSGSGNSENIINAVKYAKKCGARTIGLLGFKTGGKLAPLVDCAIIVQSNHYGPIEDVHLMLNHILASWFAYAKRKLDGSIKGTNTAVPYTHE